MRVSWSRWENKSLKVTETLERIGGREKKGTKSEEAKHVQMKSPHLLKIRVMLKIRVIAKYCQSDNSFGLRSHLIAGIVN